MSNISSPSPSITMRLNKILKTSVDKDLDTLDALRSLSTFFKENTLEARRNLRSKLERRSLSLNEDFLFAFRRMKVVLESVYDDLLSMDDSVKNMATRLHATKTQTIQLIDQTTRLKAHSSRLSLESEIATAFLNSFQLSPSEQATIRGTEELPMSPEFFTVLDRVQTIYDNCQILLQSGHQSLAFDIREQMASYQEAALEKLFRWTRTHCRNIEMAETNFILTQAMTYLQERPSLFEDVIDEYCTVRRSVMVRAFICALTEGGPEGTPKPIESHAHDPKRYIGDMLAWLHQTIPSEKENLLTLLKGCDKTDVTEQVQLALGTITEGLVHPLRTRVDQIIASETRPSMLYSIAGLVDFYEKIIVQVVPSSLLAMNLKGMLLSCQQTFLNVLDCKVKEHLKGPYEINRLELLPNPGILKVLNLMKEILAVANVSSSREEDIKKIVSCMLQPLLIAVNESAARLPSVDMAVYLLNCFQMMQSTLSVYEFVDDRLERIQAQIDAQLDTLASEQATNLVASLSLGAIYTILQEPERGPLSTIPGMEAKNVQIFMDKLESLFISPDVLLLPQMNQLISSYHRSIATRQAFEVVGAIYKQLYEAVRDPSNNYRTHDELLKRTPEEVMEILLSP